VSTPPGRTILDHVYRTAGAAEYGGCGDDELLQHALTGRRPEADTAFVVLVQRHAQMIYRTCFANLRNSHDADEAFQATFLVLVRKAKSLRTRKSVGPWLFEVAQRVTAHARVAAQRRAHHESQAGALNQSPSEPPAPEHLALLHDALNRLPAHLRLPVVCCDLEELSYGQAAEKLGLTVPTLRNRLARGRRRLKVQLRRHGSDSTAAMAAYQAIGPAPTALIHSTANLAASVALGTAAATLTPSLLALTNQGIQSMLLIKLKTAGLAAITTAVLLAGAYGLSGQSNKPDAKSPEAPKPNSPIVESAKPPADTPATGPASIVARLTGPASIDKPNDLPLRDVLDILSEQYHVTFVVNFRAFDLIGNKTPLDSLVRLQRMPNVTLDAILRDVLPQVSGAVMVRQNHLELTSIDQAVMEARNGVVMTFPEDQQPLVNVACSQRPIEAVLNDLSRQSGRNVILDARVKDRDQLTISLTLLNTPLDTAVRMISEMVDLKTFSIDNVFLVTTPGNAAALISEEGQLLERRKSTFAERATPLPPPAKPKP
jgi:RNA polymerase sigma factor (sigma-70 family)